MQSREGTVKTKWTRTAPDGGFGRVVEMRCRARDLDEVERLFHAGTPAREVRILMDLLSLAGTTIEEGS